MTNTQSRPRCRKRGELQVLIVAWAPAQAGRRPFDPTTYCGARMHELAGKPLAHFAALESLNVHPVNPESPPPEAHLHRRAIAVLQAHPLMPVLLVGRETSRAFGLDNQLGRVGYLAWFNTGERICAVMPHPSARNRWWSRPENVEAARLFLRTLSEARPLVPLPDGRTTDAIDLEELEHICEVFAPTVEDAAHHFRVSVSTMERRLRDPEFREVWERGHGRARNSLRRARMRKALSGGSDGLGDTAMMKYLSQVLLGERIDEGGRVHIQIGDRSESSEIRITRHQLDEVFRQVNAEFGILDDREVEVAPDPGDVKLLGARS